MDILQPLRPVVNKSIPPGNTVANTIVEKKFDSGFTLPANTLQVGDAIVIHTAGVYSAVSGSSVQARVQLGSQQILQPLSIPVGAGTNYGWAARTTLVVLEVGATGKIDAQSTIQLQNTATGSTGFNAGGAGLINIDLTVDQDYNVFVTWNKANTGNTMTLRQFIAQMLRPLGSIVE